MCNHIDYSNHRPLGASQPRNAFTQGNVFRICSEGISFTGLGVFIAFFIINGVFIASIIFNGQVYSLPLSLGISMIFIPLSLINGQVSFQWDFSLSISQYFIPISYLPPGLSL
ncbi:uncharacterized protein LACBIDRAFT_330408 [Laccaria bicolor S238N-H82]|uniref:Predicted protein n=1 Tax=Laccaria bicolor (strain S238N-H82 / ATCC MYA-4686) TaxID=486041 RepID=B0DL77_LACBS|nr:uncharacterized protein LACBIDRAFT_330408 [Laccaria bicolor S238N-H82]EDR04513.1 predicted protein [Laccaria bicolor S238N-H82]|eukprot:XP_001884685.1 predicted protein [Laccaria bicolor S238N-H82]